MKYSIVIFLAAFVGLPVSAEVRLPRLFGDHMILQQEAANAIWGFADPGEKITVRASWGKEAVAVANGEGDWKVFLETPSFGTGHSLTVSGKNTIEIKDVAIGEVWLCAGQSNMGWSTGNSFEAEGETNIDLPGLRLFKSAREHWHEPLKENRDRLSQWKRCTPESAAETSAVSYYFGKTLHLALDVPVGIIQRAYAGTPIEGWMPWEIQKDDPRALEHKKGLDEGASRKIGNGETVDYYRSSWHDLSGGNVAKDFPFQFTQLPSWNPPQTSPVEGLEASWAVNREMMRLVTSDVLNTGMAVSIDTGNHVDLHPKNKKPIGIRHALFALKNTCGKDVVGAGPRFRKQSIEGDRLILSFDSIGGGLVAARPGNPDAFAIAGEDRQWRWANAIIAGNTVVLSSPEVSRPVAARYAWAMNPSQRNLLYNREGLPASPFRTDSWELFDSETDEIVQVHKPAKPPGHVSRDWGRPAMTEAPAALAARASSDTSAQNSKPATESDGLAPEVTDLNAADVSYALEAKLPDLEEPYIAAAPEDRGDGIPVEKLGVHGGDRIAILKFADEIAAGDHGEIDSLLLFRKGKLLFESYYRRGRINYPHYQMSITKSYTAMAVGRAIKLGHLTTASLDRPVVDFLEDIDRSKLVEGADAITLAEALNMHSGVRIDKAQANKIFREDPESLRGQGQIQAYLEHSSPIPPSPREYKYQGSDPSMAMQVLEASVPGSAREFIEKELLGRMGIENFAWQEDVSGLPKSAAGSSMRSRDMLKWGMLVLGNGRWNREQLIPKRFIAKATERLHTNSQGTSYGFFWWRHDMKVNGRKIDCISGRGAGGQFLLVFPELDLIGVITSHNKGMGTILKTFPERVLTAFLEN